MKERLLTNWNLGRVLYLLMGLAMIVQSIFYQHWIGLAVGAYFAAMGLFAFGCASGNCYGGSCEVPTRSADTSSKSSVETDQSKKI